MPSDQTTIAARAVPLLVCLLRARAARLAGQVVRAHLWALLGLAAIIRWPGLRPMIWAFEATDDRCPNTINPHYWRRIAPNRG